MQALRNLARSACTRVGRLPTSSTITAASFLTRPASGSALRGSISSTLTRSAGAAFSTTCGRFDEYSQQLAAKLGKEIELESQDGGSSTTSDENSQSFLSEFPDWSVLPNEGEQDVFLQKLYENEEITVHFSISDFNAPLQEDSMDDDAMADEDGMDMQSGGANTKGAINQGRTSGGNFKVAPEDSIDATENEDVGDMDQTPAFPVNVTVLIRRPQQQSAGSLRFDLLADSGEFLIQSFTHLPSSSASAVEQIRASLTERPTAYAGPPFEQLDEEVQQNLDDYLESRGLTSHLANFVPDYVDVKEQREYLAWLKRVRTFVESE